VSATSPVAPKTPYVGLVPYSEDDADFFFGRDEERWIVAANLRADRLTILYGPSGVGKTSLLQAGVLPDLREEAGGTTLRVGRKPVAVCTFRAWQDEPLPRLMDALREAAAEPLGGAVLPVWERGDSVVEALRAWTDGLQTLLVVLDQFEDYFLYHDDEARAGTFGGEFPALVNESGLRVNFMISIREDAWAKLDRFEGRIPSLFANYVRVGHLSPAAARRAIEAPVEEWNRRLPPGGQRYTVEDELVEAVVVAAASGGLALTDGGVGANPAAASAGQVEAPFLQLVMERLWRATVRAGGHALTLSTLEQLGGAERIVENHLLEALRALTPAEQAVAADVFRFLVTRSRTKIAHQASDLAEWTGRPEAEVSSVLEQLCRGESGRVLRPVTPPAGTDGVTRYELFHDVLAGPIVDWRRTYEQERARRAALRRFLRVGAVLASVTAVFVALGIWALVQRNDAKRATTSAVSLALASAASPRLARHPDEALLLSLEAYRSRPTPEAASSATAALEAIRGSGAEAILRANGNEVRAVALSPDGRTLASAEVDGADGVLRLWDVPARRALGAPIRAHTGQIWGIAFSPDGRTLASAGHDGKVRLWDVREQKPLAGPGDVHAGLMTAVAFSPDGRTLAFGGRDRLIRLWDVRRRRFVGPPLRGHSDRVVSVAFSPDGSTLASAGYDRTVRLWSLRARREPARILRGHTREAVSVSFSPDGRTLASSGLDGTVRLWYVRGAKPAGVLRPGAGWIWSVAFSPDGRVLASAGFDRTVRLWDIRTRRPGGPMVLERRPPLRGHMHRVVAISFSPDARTLASASYDGTVRIWNVQAPGSLSRTLHGHTDEVKSVAFSPEGDTLASAGWDGSVRRWDVNAPRPSGRPLGAKSDALESVVFGSNGSTLATAGHEDAIRLRDAATGRLIRTLHPRQGTIYGLAVTADGGTLASAGNDGTVWLWDTASGEQLGQPLSGHGAVVRSVAFSPDGRTLASAGDDGTIRLWAVPAGTPVAVLDGGDDFPLSVAFSPDGSTLAAGGAGGLVELWDIGARQLRGQSLDGHDPDGNVQSVAFSPNGRVLASGSADGTVRLWDVAGRKALGKPLRGVGAVASVAFSPDGRTLASAEHDQIRLWTGFLWSDFADLREQACGLVVGNLTESEWAKLAAGVSYRATCAE
jgi:WD40 repeat protein